MAQNTELTRMTQQLSQRIEALTVEIHARLVPGGGQPCTDDAAKELR